MEVFVNMRRRATDDRRKNCASEETRPDSRLDNFVRQVKQFLLEVKLPDPRPLIQLCDRHGFIGEMIGYLYDNGLQNDIEVKFCVCYL